MKALLARLFRRRKKKEKKMSYEFSAEKLEKLEERYKYVAQVIGHIRENFNYYIRQFDHVTQADKVMNDFISERNKLQVEIEFLREFLKG